MLGMPKFQSHKIEKEKRMRVTLEKIDVNSQQRWLVCLPFSLLRLVGS
jgi:hypothetical protein